MKTEMRRILPLCVSAFAAAVAIMGTLPQKASAQAQDSALAQCNACLLSGDVAGALAAGRIAVQDTPDKAEAWLAYGNALYLNRDFENAESALQKADQDSDSSKTRCAALDLLGNVYVDNARELEQAQDCFSREMAQARDAMDHSAEAKAHNNLGLLFRKESEFDKAQSEFEEALQLESDQVSRAEYQANRAQALLDNKKIQQSVDAMETAVGNARRIDTRRASARLLVPHLLLLQGYLLTHAGIESREIEKANPTGPHPSLQYFRAADDKLQHGINWPDLDAYNKALGFKYLGELIECQANAIEATRRYQAALAIANNLQNHQELTNDLRTKILNLVPLKTKVALGALDIGAKGIKAILIDVYRDTNGRVAMKEIWRHSENTDLVASLADNGGDFGSEAMTKTANAVRSLIIGMNAARQETKPKFILVGGSSSLALGRNRQELAQRIFMATKDLSGAPASQPGATAESATPFITSGDEMLYDIMGSVRFDELPSSALSDIGSGNGRFGYVVETSRSATTVAEDIPYGSVSLSTAAEKARHVDEDYVTALERVASNELGSRMRREIQHNPGPGKRKQVYLLGGASYALVTLMHPEAAKDGFVPITHEDMQKFYDKVKNSGTEASPYRPSTDNITDQETRELAMKQIDDVHKNVFRSRNQLLSAALLLKTLDTNMLKPNQTITFSRTGGWAIGMAEFYYLTLPSSQ